MNPPVDPGSLRQLLIYQEAVEVRGRTGSVSLSWDADGVDKFEVRAKVEPLSGRELSLARQVQSQATHKVTLRYRPGISTVGRFLFKGTSRTMQIESTADLESRGRWIVASCIEAD